MPTVRGGFSLLTRLLCERPPRNFDAANQIRLDVSSVPAFVPAIPDLAKEPQSKPALQVDAPVKTEASKVVFNMGHLAFAGDRPIGWMHMKLMIHGYREHQTPLEVVAGSIAPLAICCRMTTPMLTKGRKRNPYKVQILALK